MLPLYLLVLSAQAVLSKNAGARSRSSGFVERPVHGRQQRVPRLTRSNARRRLDTRCPSMDGDTSEINVRPKMLVKRDNTANDWFWCIFPFRYNGQCYYDFTSDGDDQPWCSTRVNSLTSEHDPEAKGYLGTPDTNQGECEPGEWTWKKGDCNQCCNQCICDSERRSYCTTYTPTDVDCDQFRANASTPYLER